MFIVLARYMSSTELSSSRRQPFTAAPSSPSSRSLRPSPRANILVSWRQQAYTLQT